MNLGQKITPDEEAYVHFMQCIQSLNNAWAYLKAIRAPEQKSAFTAAAFRLALVEYGKPYRLSYGIHKKYKLPPDFLSGDDVALHDEILTLRDRVLAHSDLNVMDAKVSVPAYPGKPILAANSEPSLPDCDSIIGLIERTLDKMYLKRAKLEKALPQNTTV